MNTNHCIDPDGNVIRRGMGVIHQGLEWRVQHTHKSFLILVHIRPDTFFTWTRRVPQREFRSVHIVGFQIANPWPNGNDPTELALYA